MLWIWTIVSSRPKNVVFENEHVGWFVAKSGSKRTPETGQYGSCRTGPEMLSFLACFSSRNALTPEFLGAVKDEATHLRQRVRERLERRGSCL